MKIFLTVCIALLPMGGLYGMPDPDIFDGSQPEQTAEKQSESESTSQQSEPTEAQNPPKTPDASGGAPPPQGTGQEATEPLAGGSATSEGEATQAGAPSRDFGQYEFGREGIEQSEDPSQPQAGGSGITGTPEGGGGSTAQASGSGGTPGSEPLVDLDAFGVEQSAPTGDTGSEQAQAESREFGKIKQGSDKQISVPENYEKDTSMAGAEEKLHSSGTGEGGASGSSESGSITGRNRGAEQGEAVPSDL